MKKAVGIGVIAGAVVIALVALIVVLCTRSQNQDDGGIGDDQVSAEMTDAQRFKEAYESLNDTVREGTNYVYSPIDIPENNPIKYVTVAEALEVLDKPEAVLYVGASWCPWCRGAVPVLLDVAKEYNVKELYYLNLDDDKSLFEVQNGELVETRHGSEDYYKLLNKLAGQLQDYIITGSDGQKYDTGEKRIYQPDVYGIKDGKIVARKDATVTLKDGQTSYDQLTEAQKEELKQAYEELFRAVYGDPNEVCGSKEETCS